ncbi:MAG: hypothetical protein U5N58_00095 [Actinomycetota bacterium]|nr:hypothetical protein [Actinomycetota bacterium]
MRSILTVYRKELTDYFSSKKFIILLALVYVAGLSSVYVALQNIRDAASGVDANIFLKLFTTFRRHTSFFYNFHQPVYTHNWHCFWL